MKCVPLLRQEQCWPRARFGTASGEAVAHLGESCSPIEDDELFWIFRTASRRNPVSVTVRVGITACQFRQKKRSVL